MGTMGTPLMDNGDDTWSVSGGASRLARIQVHQQQCGRRRGEHGRLWLQQWREPYRHVRRDEQHYTACFNTCPGESCTPDPDPADITFRANMAEQELTSDQAACVGAFTGWQGGAIEMTDADGDGVWEHTENISGGANVDYKFSIGHPDVEGVVEESGEFVMVGDTTNWTLAGCGVDNGLRIQPPSRALWHGRGARGGASTLAQTAKAGRIRSRFERHIGGVPEPAEGRVVVGGLTGAAHVSVVDVQGRAARVWSNLVLNGQTELSLEGLHPGFYHVVVEQGDARGVQRLVIK